MKLVSWNVNGLRACLGKGFLDYCTQENADVICLQETKLQPEQAVFELHGYHRYFYSAEKKGYSGTLIYTRVKPLNAWNGIGVEAHSHEGRAITLEFEDYYLVNVYVPNSQNELARIDYRMQWEDDLRAYLKDLDSKKPVILCGDLNVAHQEMDLKNPKTNRMNPGFTDQEREKMNALLASGFADTFRTLHPEEITYSWWSYRNPNWQTNNKGRRLDHIWTTPNLEDRLVAVKILKEARNWERPSDHVPVIAEIKR